MPPAVDEVRAIEAARVQVPKLAPLPTAALPPDPEPPQSVRPNPLLGFGPQRVSRRSLFSPGLVADARAHFEARLARPVSDDEARKFLGDLTDYFLAFKGQYSRQKGDGDG